MTAAEPGSDSTFLRGAGRLAVVGGVAIEDAIGGVDLNTQVRFDTYVVFASR